MDVIRRNTDYAIRIMVNLVRHPKDDRLMSARQLASAGNFSYQLGCKILQKLHKAGLVKSTMGPKGGFALNRKPSEITLMDIVKVLQGSIRLNQCLADGKGCEFKPDCEISIKLACLQLYIEGYLREITLDEVLQNGSEAGNLNQGDRRRKK